jgi:hypothetical protein
MLLQMDSQLGRFLEMPTRHMLFRAFLIEPEVLIQIRDVVRNTGTFSQDKAAAQTPGEAVEDSTHSRSGFRSGHEPGDVMEELVHAFDAKTMAGNLDIARLLSAIPDLGGEVSPRRKIRFHRIPIADEFDTFLPRPGPLTVVLIADSDAAGHAGDRDQ